MVKMKDRWLYLGSDEQQSSYTFSGEETDCVCHQAFLQRMHENALFYLRLEVHFLQRVAA